MADLSARLEVAALVSMAGRFPEAASSANGGLTSRVKDSTAGLVSFFAFFAACAAFAFLLHFFSDLLAMLRGGNREVTVEVPTVSYINIGISYTISRTVFMMTTPPP